MKTKILYIMTLVGFSLLLPIVVVGQTSAAATKTVKSVSAASSSEVAKPTKPSPTDVIQNYEREIKEVVVKYDRSQGEEALKKRESILKDKVDRYFAFDELARLSLSKHWNALSKTEKANFTNVFRQLIQRSYLRKSQDLVADYDVEYGKETVEGETASVKQTIKKDDLDVEVIYNLMQRRGHWVIYNVVMDNLNLLHNYRSQFNRIIQKKSFAELLDIMERTLDKPTETV